MAGRPTKLNQVTQERICKLLRIGVPRDRAARLSGVAPGTFHRWMQWGAMTDEELVATLISIGDGTKFSTIYRDFREAILLADDELIRKCMEGIGDIVDPGPRKKKAEAGTRLNAMKFLLTHRFPGEYTPRTDVRHEGPDGGPVQVTAKVEVQVRPLFSDEQLATMGPEAIAASIAALLSAGGGQQ